MRLMLAGGGTGGHLFPAVALAQLLQKQEAQAEVLFVGTERGLEKRLLPKLGLPLATVDMAGVVGRGWRGYIGAIPRMLKSLIQARRIVKAFRPDIVVGVGGYASVPALLAAKWRGVPYLIHEQNAVPGVSNRLLGRWARTVCLSFPDRSRSFTEKKTRLTGNPLRSGFDEIPVELNTDSTLLIFGGSRGARAINQVVKDSLPIMKEWGKPPHIIHQTGEEDLEEVRRVYRDAGYENAQVVAFIDDMVTAYREASLVVCRAGATTLAELTACGRPAILIPFPYATGDHQTANARTLEEAGAAKVVAQSELTAEGLAGLIQRLFADRGALQEMAERGRRLSQPHAAEHILNECRSILNRPTLEVN